jgi:hypothetical protein
MEYDNEIGEGFSPIDIDFVLKTVESGKLAGLAPENILDANELSAYYDYLDNGKQQPTGHYDNLTGAIDDGFLSRLAQDVVNWVKYDEDSRSNWSLRESEGIRRLGFSGAQDEVPPFEGASQVVHPLLIEAVTEFHARAIAEMWPPEGPVKSIVLGAQDEAKMAQAQRVQDYMNYQYTEDMPGGFEEEDALLFRLPISGSVFKKVYYDPLTTKVCSRMVEPADFIVPFNATDLATAPRYTHRYREHRNTFIKKIRSGFYAEPKVVIDTNNETSDYPIILDEIDKVEGKQNNNADEKNRHTILEVSVFLDIKGFEDLGEDGLPSMVELPYVVWVDRDALEVLRIQRNWNPKDELKKPELSFTHYRFMPGLGFYGLGLYHLIGGMADSATGTLRSLLDAAAFANLQGGFKTRDARINKNGAQPIAPGVWQEVDASFDELSKSFFKLPYGEPSPTLFQLLGYLDERGQKFIGTTSVMDGSGNPNAPVGTTLALIEQGSKKFSSIHRRLHVAHKNEFRILARLNSMYLPEDGYPYAVDGADKNIYPADFDDRVDIIPVSDPSIISSTQRIVQAQAVLDLAKSNPDKMDVAQALQMMLEAMKVPGYKKLLQTDKSLQSANQKSLELDIAIKQAELEKIQAERTESAIRGLYSAIQAAQLIAMNPNIAPIADQIYLSGGGIDANGAPIAQTSQLPQLQTENAPQMPTNTSPGFPDTGSPPQPTQPESSAPENSYSPEIGAMQGIETQVAD